MLHFKWLKITVSLLLLLLVGACVSTAPSNTAQSASDAEVLKKADPDGSVADSTAESTKSVTGLAPLPQIPDPMNVVLPLELIKGYDQVNVSLAAKNFPQAVGQLEQLQARFADQSGPSYRLARIYLEQQNYEKALAALEKSLSINPNNYYAENLKGVILRELGKFTEAKNAYLKALDIYPRHASSHLNLAILADIYLYDLALALTHYQYYLDLTPVEDKKVDGWLIDLKRRKPDVE